MDLTELRAQGVQVIRDFFPEDVRQDLRRRAEEVLRLREEGKLATDSQDAMGLADDWYQPILHDGRLVRLAVDLYGPDVCGSGWRVLMKDRFFRSGVKVHQDAAYNQGDCRKLNVFIPLTRVNDANGGLYFYKESHLYGPVLRGGIDPARVEPMEEVCPDADVGDVIVADFLTWHYSGMAKNTDPRIMLQLVYQPASDPSSTNLVAGVQSSRRRLIHKTDAMGLMESQLNAKTAQGYFDAGNLDRARRWAVGLVTDDPDHAGAALLLSRILRQDNDPGALHYLEQARTALEKLKAQLQDLEVQFGLRAQGDAPPAGAPAAADASGGPWKPLHADWQENGVGPIDSQPLPIALPVPGLVWEYGATTRTLIQVDAPAAIRLRAQAMGRKVGVCLLAENYSELKSDVHVIPADGEDRTIMLAIQPSSGSVRILVRNEGDAGDNGQLIVKGLDILQMVPA